MITAEVPTTPVVSFTKAALMGALSMGGTTLMVLQMGKIDSTRPLYSLLNALAALLIAATLWLGFDTSFTVGSALDAAEQLLRTSR